MKTVAVVGPGLMGLGITQVAAAAGLQVLLVGRDGVAAPSRGLADWRQPLPEGTSPP